MSTPERLGRYDILDKIATGGMAEVFRARLRGPEGFSRSVVIKRMLPVLAAQPDLVKMFLDEARLHSHLVHENVVQVFELGEEAGQYYIAMEMVDGPPLSEIARHELGRARPLPVEVCAYVVARAADGLHYAHERKDDATGKPLHIVHRDVSPRNILVSMAGDVKVADFGVARADVRTVQTRSGVVKGTIAYMSPEQVRAEELDGRSDVFSLGVVLHELLARRRLFDHDSDLVLMKLITESTPALPSQRNRDVDAALDDIVARALQKSRDDRYPSARALAEALDAWLRARPGFEGKRTLERIAVGVRPARAGDGARTPRPASGLSDERPVTTPIGAIALKRVPGTPTVGTSTTAPTTPAFARTPSAPAVTPAAPVPIAAPVPTVASAPKPVADPGAPAGFAMLHCERDLACASWRNLFIILINGEIHPHTFDTMRKHEEPFAKRVSRMVVITLLRKPGKMATLPADTRRAAAKLSDDMKPYTSANLLCVLGSGFWAATARVLFSTIVYITAKTGDAYAKTSGSVDEAATQALDHVNPTATVEELRAVCEAVGRAVDALA